MSDLDLQRVWLIECDRCANTGVEDVDNFEDASLNLLSLGWTAAEDGQFCPQCSGR